MRRIMKTEYRVKDPMFAGRRIHVHFEEEDLELTRPNMNLSPMQFDLYF